jgi:hypothetical protein
MCAQCMAAAAAATGGASGLRAWLGTRRWRWLTTARLRAATGALLLIALALSATGSA